MLWEAALKDWNPDDGDRVVTFQDFDTFLLMCDFKGWSTRDTHRRRMRALGLIDYPDGAAMGRGHKKHVTIHTEPRTVSLLPPAQDQ
jgi:hypothetical protein